MMRLESNFSIKFAIIPQFFFFFLQNYCQTMNIIYKPNRILIIHEQYIYNYFYLQLNKDPITNLSGIIHELEAVNLVKNILKFYLFIY